MVNIEIDGIPIQAKDGAMVIEAADDAGIPIPRFCYHKKLSVAANCRMCLVEVDKARKPLPACATPVTEGMKVLTRSPLALEAQKGTMEFLLINHPLDCPICDQGGECDLQEMAMGYGDSHSRFQENKRVVKDKNLGPLIATDMTRCIHCTRCVRFGEEVAGLKELGATGRGEHMEIGTYVERTVASEMSGNMIDLCPVGALTSKPYRYTARPWELQPRDTIAPHDCVGSNLQVHVRGRTVMRAVPRENEAINETWISDRDRFGYEGLNSEDRLTAPMIKREGKWQQVSWDVALDHAIRGLKTLVAKHGAGQLGALVAPTSTLEEMYLLQKLVRGMGSANIDHRLRQLDFSDQDNAPVFPWLGQSIADLEDLDAALLIGSNVRKDQPIIAHRLRKAALKGGSIMFINPVDYDFHFPVRAKLTAGLRGMERALAGVLKVLLGNNAGAYAGAEQLLAHVEVNDTHRAMAETLRQARSKTVLLGIGALTHPNMSHLRALAGTVAKETGAKLGYLPDGGNSAGGWLAGALPHRSAGGRGSSYGLHTRAMLEAGLKGYVLMGLEPEYDCADPALAIQALENAEFVVSLTSYRSDLMERYADVLLPMGPYAETSGTFINVEGRWQSFKGAVAPQGETRPAWKILRVMGNLFGIDGFNYMSSEEVLDELKGVAGAVAGDNTVSWNAPKSLEGPSNERLTRIAEVPIYGVDPVVRRAAALQHTPDAEQYSTIKISRTAAERLGLGEAREVVASQGDWQATMPLEIHDDLPDGYVVVASALPATRGMGASGSAIDLKPA